MATVNTHFDSWMRDVDACISAYCGLTSSDLADQAYRDWYDSGMDPEEAARQTLEDEGFPFED